MNKKNKKLRFIIRMNSTVKPSEIEHYLPFMEEDLVERTVPTIEETYIFSSDDDLQRDCWDYYQLTGGWDCLSLFLSIGADLDESSMADDVSWYLFRTYRKKDKVLACRDREWSKKYRRGCYKPKSEIFCYGEIFMYNEKANTFQTRRKNNFYR